MNAPIATFLEAPESAGAVEEVQGLYGSYTFSEKLLQKIWLRGNFDRGSLATNDGQRVELRYRGKWNLLGGPDFKQARLSFDAGREIVGDIELHLSAEGWAEHGHASDPAYDGVVLHVVLFPPPPGHRTQTKDGRAIPVLTLLPLLDHDLEQFAAEDAIERLAQRPGARVIEELAPLSGEILTTLFRSEAEKRWREKVRFAAIRLKRLGWEDACHHAALEILGYRFNRAPMLRIAGACPLPEWGRGCDLVETLLRQEAGRWSLQGVRPANYPRVRLTQYATWTRCHPDWPTRLARMAATLPVVERGGAASSVRRNGGFEELRQRFGDEVAAGAVNGTRLDTLICDGFFPLLAARDEQDLAGIWSCWYPGDFPPLISQSLVALGMVGGRRQPLTQGLAQGFLGWLLERENLR